MVAKCGIILPRLRAAAKRKRFRSPWGGVYVALKRPESRGPVDAFVAFVSVVIQFDFHPVGWYNSRFEFLGRTAAADTRSIRLLLRQTERKIRNMKALARELRTPVRSLVCVLAGIVLAGLTSNSATSNEPAADGTDNTPEVWMCHHDIEVLAESGADWDFVRDHLDGIKVYVGNLMGTRKHVRISDENLASLARTFQESDIQFAMECGGTLGYYRNTEPVGLRSANAEMRNIDRVASLGGTMHYLDMDGPISRTLWSGRHRFDHRRRGNTGYDNIDKCVDELIAYMKVVNGRYPDLRFFTLTNFPNWGWKGGTSYHSRYENNQDWGDYYDVISTLLREAKEAGVVNLVGVTVDSPYHYTIGRVRSVNLKDPSQIDWIARLRDLEDYVETQGMEVNLIVNSVERLEVDAEMYCEETLALIDLFQKAGGTPKRYIVQSWGHHPARMLPESDPVSMTGLTKAVIIKVKGVEDDSTAKPAR